jgi:hypothetical protein
MAVSTSANRGHRCFPVARTEQDDRVTGQRRATVEVDGAPMGPQPGARSAPSRRRRRRPATHRQRVGSGAGPLLRHERRIGLRLDLGLALARPGRGRCNLCDRRRECWGHAQRGVLERAPRRRPLRGATGTSPVLHECTSPMAGPGRAPVVQARERALKVAQAGYQSSATYVSLRVYPPGRSKLRQAT